MRYLLLLTPLALTSCAMPLAAAALGSRAMLAQQQAAFQAYPQDLRYAAVVTGANVRSEPSTKGARLTTLKQRSVVKVLGKENGWTEIEHQNGSDTTTGYIRSDLLDENHPSVKTLNQVAEQNARMARTATAAATQTDQRYHTGYSLEFAKIREQVKAGELDRVLSTYRLDDELYSKKPEDERRAKIGMLGYLERGMLRLGTEDTLKAATDFREAEMMLKERRERSLLHAGAEDFTLGLAALVSGEQSLMSYEGEDFENVLALNLSSLAYLLEGRRAAYNVARRAINFQQLAAKAFEQQREEVARELARTEDIRKKAEALRSLDILSTIEKYYAPLNDRATKLPSAYVNPFGYYLTGVIQEIESAQDPTLRDNAKISYEKAKELSPSSAVLDQAVSAMEQPRDAKSRILHVVSGTGFTPDKKVLEFPLQVPSYPAAVTVTVKLPIYEPQDDEVTTIEVQSTAGKKLGTLSTVADVEALALRSQRDRLPEQQLFVGAAVAKSFGVQTLLHNVGLGALSTTATSLKPGIDAIGRPDTRGWMSLPKSLLAARVSIPQNTSTVKIVSKNSTGRTLAAQTVTLDTRTDSICYVRAIGSQITAQANEPLWLVDETKNDAPLTNSSEERS